MQYAAQLFITVTLKLHAGWPLAPVQLTVYGPPTRKNVPLAGVQVYPGGNVGNVTYAPCPGPVGFGLVQLVTISSEQVTVIICGQVELLPQASVAVQVRVMV